MNFMNLHLVSGSGYYWLGLLPSIFLVASLLLVGGSLLKPLALRGLSWLLSRLKLGDSKLKSASLRDSSNWHSPSWEWFSQWTDRRWKGNVRPVGVWAVCIFSVVMFALVPLKHLIMPSETILAHWWFFPHVPEFMPDNEYIVLHLDKRDPLYGTRSRYVFCAKGGRIDFDEGELLSEIVYKERGDCKELLHYNFEKVDSSAREVRHYTAEEMPHGH